MLDVLALSEKLAKTLELSQNSFETPQGRLVNSFQVGTDLWLFPDSAGSRSSTLDELKEDLASLTAVAGPEDVSIIRIVVPVLPPPSQDRVRLIFGCEAVSAAWALRHLLDLPDTFEESQRLIIEGAFAPVADVQGGPVRMRALLPEGDSEPAPDALITLLNRISPGQRGSHASNLTFLEAEAGKGKTILLSLLAMEIKKQALGVIPIYVPLRKLPLEAGVGMEGIMQLIGVVGAGADRIIRATKNGLVVLLLDGMDEVSGRYDRNLIRDLLALLAEQLFGPETSVVLSGRRTESRHLDEKCWTVVGLQLPGIDDPEFRRYVEAIVDNLFAEWNYIIETIPRDIFPLVGNGLIEDLGAQERDRIITWILSAFPSVGKEQSLFFVQGLAAIGIGFRIGNRKRLDADKGMPIYIPSIWDVCRVAAAFACVREQRKIDPIAREAYEAGPQLAILRNFAIMASTNRAVGLPTPNELAIKIFAIDYVNDPERYLAITRQNAKHALLFASEAVGNSRPNFLNDWIRCAFLAEALCHAENDLGMPPDQALKIMAGARHARYTYSILLPELLLEKTIPSDLVDTLVAESNAGCETASANFWHLRAALGEEEWTCPTPNPRPLAQIEDAEFNGLVIDGELSGEDYFLDGSEFNGAQIRNVRFEGVSMIGVRFQNCLLENIHLDLCDGPLIFEGCAFTSCEFTNSKSCSLPALSFVDCSFTLGNVIRQDSPSYGEAIAKPAVSFDGCTTTVELHDFLKGDWLCLDLPVSGIEVHAEAVADQSTVCLRQILRPFFPSQVGSRGGVGCRDYIRLTALGRGSLPAGAPSPREMKAWLMAEGFADGGRSDHLYAPWSGVLGGREQDRIIRSDMIDFMVDSNSRGPVIERLIGRLNHHFA